LTYPVLTGSFWPVISQAKGGEKIPGSMKCFNPDCSKTILAFEISSFDSMSNSGWIELVIRAWINHCLESPSCWHKGRHDRYCKLAEIYMLGSDYQEPLPSERQQKQIEIDKAEGQHDC
jgi:hypothetical protein